MSEVIIRVLGPVEIEKDHVVSMIRGRTRRHILAVLAAERGSVISLDRLVELTGSSPAAVRTTICRLRKDLGDAVITTNSAGYSIDARSCDATIAETMLSEARTLDPESALDRIHAALALKRGTPFGALRHEPTIEAEAARLDECLTTATEDAADLFIQLGRHHEAISSLTAHVLAHPLRDRPRRSLMTALDHVGRTTEALREFQRYRCQLIDLGTEPPLATATLERLIANGGSSPEALVHASRTDVERVV